jgi:hypothetical protein
MEQRARDVIKNGDAMFSGKRNVDSLWQEIALNFYPKRATFTEKRDEGDEYADHLFSSYPSMARRELGNMLDEFLFPERFFSIHVDDEDLDAGDYERAFLEHLDDIQYRAMMDPIANLVTARGQTNHDFAAFGQGVLWFGLNVNRDALLFRNYHLVDNIWSENAEGRIDCNHRNWAPTARQLYHHFPKTISQDVRRACGLTGEGSSGKDPNKPFRCRHVVLPARLYDYKTKGGKQFPFVSLYVEIESETVLEEVGLTHFPYIIPQWQKVSGSVFATSMATDVLLPDGRTLQVVMRTLREAAEMHVNPPMVGVMDMIRSDIALYPGGITTADAEYDNKIGDVLRPITRDKGGFPFGVEIAEALKQDIRAGFFLDKIQLPETTSAMTATEVRRRIQEHIRAAAPISKPIQQTYNNPLCDGVFQLLREENVFPFEQMPETLQGRDIKFKFRSPLDELAEQNEAATFIEVRDTIIVPSAQIDPTVLDAVDWETATRDAARSAGFKAKWLKPKEAVQAVREEQAAKAEAARMAEEIAAVGAVGEQAGKGMEAIGRGAQALMPAGMGGEAGAEMMMPGVGAGIGTGVGAGMGPDIGAGMAAGLVPGAIPGAGSGAAPPAAGSPAAAMATTQGRRAGNRAPMRPRRAA